MSLDEAIQHCTDVLPIAETAQCAKEHIQLREWLLELKQYRERNMSKEGWKMTQFRYIPEGDCYVARFIK